MANKKKIAGILVAVVMVVAATTYVFITPYNRIAGVRIGGTLTPAPDDFTTIAEPGIGKIKTGGFPPFVVHVVLVPYEGGFITATRPDGGYWSARARIAPDGYARFEDKTFALKATEIFGEEKYPYLRKWGGEDLDRQMTGGVIVGVAEPLREWEVFLWTPR
ncbi:MAG: hypothetical protein JKY98_12915 [Gammaproteobacteria bacterium]|nr:hypothetical protein [Gammaproteobacteria bacterium]